MLHYAVADVMDLLGAEVESSSDLFHLVLIHQVMFFSYDECDEIHWSSVYSCKWFISLLSRMVTQYISLNSFAWLIMESRQCTSSKFMLNEELHQSNCQLLSFPTIAARAIALPWAVSWMGRHFHIIFEDTWLFSRSQMIINNWKFYGCLIGWHCGSF